jgi:hypothetical protein
MRSEGGPSEGIRGDEARGSTTGSRRFESAGNSASGFPLQILSCQSKSKCVSQVLIFPWVSNCIVGVSYSLWLMIGNIMGISSLTSRMDTGISGLVSEPDATRAK